MSYLEDLRFALGSGKSIALDKYHLEVEPLYMSSVFTHSLKENPTFDDTLIELSDVLSRYNKDGGLKNRYRWQMVPWTDKRINSLHLFGLSVNFADLNPMTIPPYLIPPIELVRQYYIQVIKSEKPLVLSEQFDKAISLVGAYPTAACLLLMIATRACARGQDRKILGDDIPDQDTIERFRHKIAGYDKFWVEKEPPDPPGNTYYFFTNAGMNMLLRANGLRRIHQDIASLVSFPHGARMMQLFRKHAAKQPQLVSHKLPAKYGLMAGTYLAKKFIS